MISDADNTHLLHKKNKKKKKMTSKICWWHWLVQCSPIEILPSTFIIPTTTFLNHIRFEEECFAASPLLLDLSQKTPRSCRSNISGKICPPVSLSLSLSLGVMHSIHLQRKCLNLAPKAPTYGRFDLGILLLMLWWWWSWTNWEQKKLLSTYPTDDSSNVK